MHTATILASDKKALKRRSAIGFEYNAAHHVVCGWENFDISPGKVETAIGAAFHHALELLCDFLRPKMRHADVDAATGCPAPGTHFLIHRARNDIACRPLAV